MNHGFMSCSMETTVFILARYYRTEKHKKRKAIEKELEQFLESKCITYQTKKIYWKNIIEKAADKAMKKSLQIVDGVRITKAEINTISSIGNKSLEKLAFTLLCLAKYRDILNKKNNSWVNYDFKEIFTLARISCPATERPLYINKLYNLGLLSFSKKVDNTSVRVNYICDTSDFALFVSDFRELGYEYLKYRGENYVRCAECRILIKGNKNGTKRYCSNCAGNPVVKIKKVYCIDCGKEFYVRSKNHKTTRCTYCHSNFLLQYDRDRKSQKVNSVQQKKDELNFNTQKSL